MMKIKPPNDEVREARKYWGEQVFHAGRKRKLAQQHQLAAILQRPYLYSVN